LKAIASLKPAQMIQSIERIPIDDAARTSLALKKPDFVRLSGIKSGSHAFVIGITFFEPKVTIAPSFTSQLQQAIST
jgi:hypothetical protein